MTITFTLKELETFSDDEICYHLVNKKLNSNIHPYGPLRDRLLVVRNNLWEKIQNGNTT